MCRVALLGPARVLPIARVFFSNRSPVRRLPAQLRRSFSVMVHDLARCQLEPYLQKFTTKVVQCTPVKAQAAEGEKKKKSREEKKNELDQAYEVELEDTILYPEGGGQPTDFGFIDAAPIQSVQKTSSERILHTSPTPFSPGSSVTVTVDWARRYDHMQQHSAQHLISAVFIKLFSMPTLSWWLSSAPSECFIELDASELTSEQLLQAEAECNRLIREALPMHIHTFPSVDAALADASFTARLPAHKVLGDHLKGTVRVIEIEGVDMNPCGGTHLQRTSELQLVHLPRHDKAKGHVRVFFFAGDRALRSLSSALSTQRELAALLSTTGEGQPEVVRKLQAELRALLKQNKLTSAALAEYVAKDLAQSKADVVHYHQVEGALPFLQSVCDAFTALTVGEGKEGGGEGKEGKEGKVLFLTASEGPEGKEGQWVLFGEGASELAGDVGKAMDGRGGGKGKRVQGKAARVDKRADALKLIEDRLGKAKQ